MAYLTRYFTRRPPQSAPIPGAGQTPNSAGGYTWAVDDMARLRRFLVLGSEGGTYYATERKLTKQNTKAVERCLDADGPRDGRRDRPRLDRGARAEERSGARRARARRGAQGRADPQGRPRGAAAGGADGNAPVPVRELRLGLPRLGPLASPGGRALVRRPAGRRARAPGGQVPPAGGHDPPRPPAARPPGRAGVRGQPDARRLARAGAALRVDRPRRRRPTACRAWSRASSAPRPWRRRRRRPSSSASTGCRARRSCRSISTSPDVWEALLEDMPMTALVRNLATMTRAGVLEPGSAGTATRRGPARRRRPPAPGACAPDRDPGGAATYAAGHGARGRHTWNPVARVVDALDAAFYATFANVEPSGTRMLLALDVSGSMTWGSVAGVPGLTPRTPRPRSRS